MISPEEFARALGLTVISGTRRQHGMRIRVADLCRPGLQFAGYFDVFASERPQLIGKTEMAYLNSLPPEVRDERLDRYFSYEMPCIVIARGMPCPPALLQQAVRHGVPIYGTLYETSAFTGMAIGYLSEALAPRQTCHGVLLDVFGVGVLITGESGIGKSECALELIKRGHQLVADDVVDVKRVSETRLIGEAPEMIRYFMEIRGIGIIDIRAMYGIGAVIPSKSIDLVIHLEHWVRERNYDRLGLVEESTEILEVNIPRIVLPVRPGRNLAIVIEVAARNLRLRKQGYNAAKTLDERLVEMAGKGDAE